jgi:hypothetical protein
MPNWVANKIIVTGPEADLAAFMQKHFRKDEEDGLVLDFETVVPVPAVVEAMEGATDGELGLVALGLDLGGDDPYRPTLAEVLSETWARDAGIRSRVALLAHLKEHRPEVLAAARKLIACHEAAGFTDWREWSLHHWGTKRDAGPADILFSDSEVIGFVFDTASSMPEPIFRALGILHPNLSFEIDAIDPGNGWAVTGEVAGPDARFDEADYREVYELIYGEFPGNDDEDEGEHKTVEPA